MCVSFDTACISGNLMHFLLFPAEKLSYPHYWHDDVDWLWPCSHCSHVVTRLTPQSRWNMGVPTHKRSLLGWSHDHGPMGRQIRGGIMLLLCVGTPIFHLLLNHMQTWQEWKLENMPSLLFFIRWTRVLIGIRDNPIKRTVFTIFTP